MAKYSESLFESIRNYGKMSPTEGRRRSMQPASQYKQMGTTDPLARSLGTLFGNVGFDTSSLQTTPERIAAESKDLDMSKPVDSAKAMLIRAQYIQDPQIQSAMIMRAQEIMRADQQRVLAAEEQAANAALQLEVRQSLIQRAEELGLNGVAKTLSAGGDIEEPQKTIVEFEKEKQKSKSADQGLEGYRNIVAEQYDIPKEDLLGLSEEQINKVTEGKYATPQAYLSKDGKVRMLKTLDKSGKVWAADLNKYVNPSELELAPAAQVSKVIQSIDSSMNKKVFGEEFSKLWASDYKTALSEAEDASLNFQKNLETDELVDRMFTGALADVKLSIGRLAEDLGIGGENLTEKVSNTQDYFARRGQAVLDNIKALGSGSSVSNTDREYMKTIAGQDITLTKETIKRILRIERQVLSETVNASNNLTNQAINLGFIDKDQADIFIKPPLTLSSEDSGLSADSSLRSLFKDAGIEYDR